MQIRKIIKFRDNPYYSDNCVINTENLQSIENTNIKEDGSENNGIKYLWNIVSYSQIDQAIQFLIKLNLSQQEQFFRQVIAKIKNVWIYQENYQMSRESERLSIVTQLPLDDLVKANQYSIHIIKDGDQNNKKDNFRIKKINWKSQFPICQQEKKQFLLMKPHLARISKQEAIDFKKLTQTEQYYYPLRTTILIGAIGILRLLDSDSIFLSQLIHELRQSYKKWKDNFLLVLDNATIHKTSSIKQDLLLNQHHLCLPSYSPKLNFIELIQANVKQKISQTTIRIDLAFYYSLHQVLNQFSREQITIIANSQFQLMENALLREDLQELRVINMNNKQFHNIECQLLIVLMRCQYKLPNSAIQVLTLIILFGFPIQQFISQQAQAISFQLNSKKIALKLKKQAKKQTLFFSQKKRQKKIFFYALTIYAVEFSHRSGRDLVNMAKKRTNIVPIIADARKPLEYRMLVGMVDVVFADVAQPDQARIVGLNSQYFLKKGGHFMISIKANCIDSTNRAEVVFQHEVQRLKDEGLTPQEQLTLEPYERDHAIVIGVYNV